MKGDFSRNTFRPSKAYSRVLLQQGRVQLDADWNEQVSILLHHMRMLTADCIGPYARPPAASGGGFEIAEIEGDAQNFSISFGHCWVNGLLVENPQPEVATPVSYQEQPSFWRDPRTEDLIVGSSYFVYLDVWERVKTVIEDPELREIALGGPDTAARAQIVWQVKVVPVLEGPQDGDRGARRTKADKARGQLRASDGPFSDWRKAFVELPRRARGALKAHVTDPEPGNEPCRLPPTAKYRGENQLWRVEAHRGGVIGAEKPQQRPTFKISSDNGSLIYPLASPAVISEGSGEASHYEVELISLGRDARTALAEGDWVELVDDRYALESADDDREPDSLLQVVAIDADTRIVTLKGRSSAVAVRAKRGQFLRRWDQGTVLADFVEDDANAHGTFEIAAGEIKLASGIRLEFRAKSQPNGASEIYRRGDYWLIPGREASGDIEWPVDADNEPLWKAPLGIAHHYAPLAVIQNDGGWHFEPLMRTLTVEEVPARLEDIDEF